MSCVWFWCFSVIFWIVLLSFVILSSPMSLFVFLFCSIILFFLFLSVFQNFLAKSSVLLCFIWGIMNTYVIGPLLPCLKIVFPRPMSWKEIGKMASVPTIPNSAPLPHHPRMKFRDGPQRARNHLLGLRVWVKLMKRTNSCNCVFRTWRCQDRSSRTSSSNAWPNADAIASECQQNEVFMLFGDSCFLALTLNDLPVICPREVHPQLARAGSVRSSNPFSSRIGRL